MSLIRRYPFYRGATAGPDGAVSSVDMDIRGSCVGRAGWLADDVLNSGSARSGKISGVDSRRVRSRLISGAWELGDDTCCEMLFRRRSQPKDTAVLDLGSSGRSSSSSAISSRAVWRRRVDRRRLRSAAVSWTLERRVAWWNSGPLVKPIAPPSEVCLIKRSRAPRSRNGILTTSPPLQTNNGST